MTQCSPPVGSDSAVSVDQVVAVERGEHALDHAAVDGADHRVLDRRAAERAVLGDDAELVAVLLGVGGEAVGGEGVGHRVQRGLERPVPRRTRAPSPRPWPGRSRRRPPRPAPRPARGPASASARPSSVDEHVVVAQRAARGRSRARRPGSASTAGRRRRRRGAADGDLDVAAGGQLVEVVAGDVGVQLELLGHLGGGDPVGRARGRTGRFAPGRVAEGRGDGGDRRGEVGRRQSGAAGPRPVFYLSP